LAALGERSMICTEAFPFVQEFIGEVDAQLRKINPGHGLSWIQRSWIAFCLVGVWVTGTVCWTQFERYSLGSYSVAALSWVFRKAKMAWELLLVSSVGVILKKYSLTTGHLIIDDTDRKRSKSTTDIALVHKIYDKKTGGYFMGQNLVFLLLVTDKITLPVGFRFYQPDPKKTEWNKQDEELRKQKVPKSQRPDPPANDPAFPSKIGLGLQLLAEFKKYFPDFHVQSISADAAYGSSGFFRQTAQIYPKTQVISQLRGNQKVFYRGKEVPVSEVFAGMSPVVGQISLRGEKKETTWVAARIKVEAHGQIQMVVALKYEGEEEYRYLVASDLSWRAVDVVQAYSMRWLVEVFIEDWKGYEGWGQLALQTGVDGSFRGVVLSLLVDLCLLFHPNQFARIESKKPACTVGSLREQLKNESLLACFHEILLSDSPIQRFAELKEKFSEYFVTRDSTKHLTARDLPELKGTPSLTRKFGKLKLCYA
jgi:hypothetical protein